MIVSVSKYIFDGVVEKINQSGKPFRLVKFIDVENYERIEIIANESFSSNIPVGQPCKFFLKASKYGFKTSFTVLNVEKVA